jgi:hypothetical protein
LERYAGAEAAARYRLLVAGLETITVRPHAAALLIIDPQRSFTEGAWMRSIGAGAAADVTPIRMAFGSCAAFLGRHYGRMDIMFTRCPFPADSYDWDHRLAGILGRHQPYFIKPGNNVLFPPSNGFVEWVARCIDNGQNLLVMGGCTLNSCVRVSAIETRKAFAHRQLELVVDLGMAGARAGNYLPSPTFNGLSAVASAVGQMQAAGVRVVRQVEWDS